MATTQERTIILDKLKAAFPKTKFAVRKQSYGVYNVKWTDGPTVAQVEAITNTLESGHFDGMQDLYVYDNPQGILTYVFTDRDISYETLQKQAVEFMGRTGFVYPVMHEKERDFFTKFDMYPSQYFGRHFFNDIDFTEKE